MSNRVDCPHCKLSYTLPAEYYGKAVRCTSCQQPFRVHFPSETEEPFVPELMEEAAPPQHHEDEIVDIREALVDDPPKAKRKSSRRYDDDDEEDDRSRRRAPEPTKPASKNSVRAILGGIVFLIIVGVKIWLISQRR